MTLYQVLSLAGCAGEKQQQQPPYAQSLLSAALTWISSHISQSPRGSCWELLLSANLESLRKTEALLNITAPIYVLWRNY